MGITVDGEHYAVQRGKGSFARVHLVDGSTTKCTRNYAKGTQRLETDTEMQTRVQAMVTGLNAGQERA